MASTSSSRNMVPFAVDDKEPVIIDNSGFVSEPAMTSVESSVWGEELIIPHKLEGSEKDTEVPHSNPPVEKQPTNNEDPSTEDPAPRQDKISSCSQDPGAQGGNEENANTLVNDKENLAQDVGTNNVEVRAVYLNVFGILDNL
ncbi:hypothetical protein P8452_17216 [Trifolium repens]|nr:hypothetical protein P8452_17216 [Trifolium repens]